MILDILSVLSSKPTLLWAQTNPCLCFVIRQYLVKSVIIAFSKEFFTIFCAWSFMQPYSMLLSHKSAFFLEILNIDSNMLCRSILSLASFLHNKAWNKFCFLFQLPTLTWRARSQTQMRNQWGSAVMAIHGATGVLHRTGESLHVKHILTNLTLYVQFRHA